jgi:hypothetical protein
MRGKEREPRASSSSKPKSTKSNPKSTDLPASFLTPDLNSAVEEVLALFREGTAIGLAIWQVASDRDLTTAEVSKAMAVRKRLKKEARMKKEGGGDG